MTFVLRTTGIAACLLSLSLVLLRAQIVWAWKTLASLGDEDASTHEWTDLSIWDAVAVILAAAGSALLALASDTTVSPVPAALLGMLGAAGMTLLLRASAAAYLASSLRPSKYAQRHWSSWVKRLPSSRGTTSPGVRTRLGVVCAISVLAALALAAIVSAGMDRLAFALLAVLALVVLLFWGKLVGLVSG